ncbi:hypothetical protein [Vibrio rotiferianus]|uniref:hypothetical protein n=1 Tax=Vibrio rotiferianus TaxID=190895 RepID=UPI00148BAADB|nr:hypothetical protein [Vibrio rotiferianus]NOH68740.1 hypothetical protein [Vibrio rotiferianus]
MLRKALASFGIGVMLIVGTGCMGDSNTPEAQSSFNSQLNKFRVAVNEAEDSGNQIKLEALEKEVTNFLNKSRNVELWYAQVESVRKRSAGGVAVKTSNDSQSFLLIITNPELQNMAAHFEDGDSIFFSGNLGREGSLTFSGKLENPEYILTPTEVKLSADGPTFNQ